jgi:hypothetical protein
MRRVAVTSFIANRLPVDGVTTTFARAAASTTPDIARSRVRAGDRVRTRWPRRRRRRGQIMSTLSDACGYADRRRTLLHTFGRPCERLPCTGGSRLSAAPARRAGDFSSAYKRVRTCAAAAARSSHTAPRPRRVQSARAAACEDKRFSPVQPRRAGRSRTRDLRATPLTALGRLEPARAAGGAAAGSRRPVPLSRLAASHVPAQGLGEPVRNLSSSSPSSRTRPGSRNTSGRATCSGSATARSASARFSRRKRRATKVLSAPTGRDRAHGYTSILRLS